MKPSITSFREVCLEIYLNGVYHGTETFQVPAEDEDQVECRIIPDAICDLFGSSAVIDSLERIDSPEDMPVSSSVVEGGAVQVDSVNDSTASASVVERDGLEEEVKNVSSVLVSPTELAGSGTDASPETPENSPTESTKVWMMKKASGFFQMLFGVPEPLCVPDTHQPTSATDLVDSEQETPVDLDNLEQPDVPVPIVSEQETPVDLVDLEESSVSALNRSEAEPVSTEGLEVEVKDAISDLKSPTLVCEDLSDSAGPSGRTSGIDQSGMDASPETPVKISPKESTKVRKKGKIRAFFKKLFRIDPAVPETLCLPDASVPEMDPESELSDAYESSDEGPSVAEMVSEWDLSDSYESSDEGPSVAEMVSEWDLSDSYESSDEGPSVAEMDPEWDLSDAYESCDEGPSVPEMDPESDLSDAYETCDEGPSVPEMDPESDLSDSDESCVQGPSSPCACTSKQELVQEGPDSRFAERVKGCTKDLEPVTEVWNNIFIGNEVIAEDRMKLKELGITHILNAAALKNNLRVLMGVPCEEDLMETVDTGASYYRGMNITYCRMPTTQTSNISKYFVPAAKFIHKAMKNPQNKVLIHCAKGVSHAPTLFLAYLMIHHDMTGDEAIDYLIQVRYIKPDLDFLKKLTILDQLLCTMRLVHKTTSYRRENDKTWLKKLEAKILQKKCCCTPDKECGRIERRFTLFRAFHLRTCSREVCLEIYLNGVYHGTETFQVPAEDEDQVECRIIPDAICDLFGSSAVIDSLERIDSPEDMPVSSSVVEGGAVQVDSVNDSTASASVVERDGLEDEVKNVSSVLVSPTELAGSGIDASPETPENSPTESTKVWIMKKASGFFQMLFGVPEPLCVPDTHQPTSATDLVDSEQETPVDLDNLEQPDVPVPIVSEQETPVDLVDLEESSVSALNRSEAEPVSTEGLEVEVRDAISDLKSPTLVCEDLSDSAGPSGRTSGIDQSGMDASPETPVKISPKESTKVRKKGKIRAFFKKLFRIDPAVPETLCLPDASVPEMDPESELSDAYESSDEGPSVAEMVSEWDLSDSYESCDEGPSVAEMDPESDLSDAYESCDEGPSVPEMDPESDLSDSDESCVQGPSSPCACTSKQELVQEGPDSRFAERVKGCTKDLEPVTEVWNNIFIGNEVIAEDRMKLKELGITHILNAAALKNNLRVLMGVPCEEDLMETVDTGASYYRGMNITYCRMPTTQTSNISKYFVPAAKFIHKAMKNPQNKVLIHCAKGVSHAPTLFLAYLMIHHDMTGDEAIDYLIQVRYIKPDLDFLKKLTILDQLLCTMRLVHKTTSYRRENDKTWLKKLEAKILQKKCCCTPDKECGRIERRFTLFRAFHLRSA
ncbi:uncharacterized protein LOC120463031 [Pimephales promelas]|uniref:uncharacterized protein LOC120463031 n=1 Tax=Pimephales promelas TaxID=90988 RepID=UPI001955B956|nr:uncharacterized protein LOC120463031 [Pimephales promelas]